MTPDYTTAYVLRQLAALEAVQASGATISGQPPRVYDALGAVSFAVLPPADEEPDVAARIAMYRRWLARHGQGIEGA
jgi:hypothetical protein